MAKGKRMMKGHGEHEHLIISSPALPISSKHRITHQPPPHSMNPHDAPAAIASRSKQPPPSYHIGAAPVPLAILFEAAGTGRATEARQIDHGIAQHPKHGHAHAAAVMTSRGKQAAPSAPRPPTRRDGERKRDDEGRTGKGEARTTWGIIERGKQATSRDR